MKTKYILSVDPGKTTGVALFSWDPGGEPELIDSDEVEFSGYAKFLRDKFDTHSDKPEFHVVCERFTINAQTVRNSQAPFSLEKIGVLKQILLDYGLDVESLNLQSPADAKAMFDNTKLKKLEYWHRGGEGHALDAIRHGLLYMVRLGWSPLDRLRS
jgi:hypothetical protein